MLSLLATISKDIVNKINRNNFKFSTGNIYANSNEKKFTSEIEFHLRSKRICCKRFKVGQERWANCKTLDPNFKYNAYELSQNGFKPDIVIQDKNGLNLIEIKKIYSTGQGLYNFLYTGNRTRLSSHNWGEAAIFLKNNNKFLTFFHEGQLWQDAMRLINFASTKDQNYLLGFFQNSAANNISTLDFKNRLHYVMHKLQKRLIKPIFVDKKERVFSQLDQHPNPSSRVYTFLPPKSSHPIWFSWANINGFQDGVYPSPDPNTKEPLYAFLLEVKM